MTEDPKASFSVIFKKLAEFNDSDEAREVAAVADEADEIQKLRRIIEETNTVDCVEFATT